jgi:hypothetical protein
LAPNDGNAWLSLGTAYLQQVENDARLMTSTYNIHRTSSLRTAETFAEEGKLVEAENAYKAAIASGFTCAVRTRGVRDYAASRKEDRRSAPSSSNRKQRTGSHCGLAALGEAVAQRLLKEIQTFQLTSAYFALAKDDPGFVRVKSTSLPCGAVSADQAKSRYRSCFGRRIRAAEISPVDIGSRFEEWLSLPTDVACY